MAHFGEKLKKLRLERKMSQEQLATLLGTSKQVISRYENGQRSPKISIVQEYAEKLGVPLDYLIDNNMNEIFELVPDAIPYKRGRKIPIVGTIPAGSPILAIENIEGYDLADVPEDREYFFLRVKGDSMVNANIFEGDLVLVEKCPCAENGQIVACIINGEEATLKRFYRQKDTVILQPETPAYPPIIVSCKDFDAGYARILGVVRELKRKL